LEGRDLVQYKKIARIHAENSLKEYLQEVAVKKGKVIDGSGNVKEVLLDYIKKGNYDLVAVGSRGTSGFKALLGSVASYILKEVPNDVLVYVPKD
jgi:nucleotide-binding universal stress UspA family protein